MVKMFLVGCHRLSGEAHSERTSPNTRRSHTGYGVAVNTSQNDMFPAWIAQLLFL
jgi:hypothetical protein